MVKNVHISITVSLFPTYITKDFGHLTLSSMYTHFNTMKKKSFRKTFRETMKLLKMSNFTFSHNVFYAVCMLKSFNPFPDDKIFDCSKLK